MNSSDTSIAGSCSPDEAQLGWGSDSQASARRRGGQRKNPALEEISFVGLWLVVLFVSLDLLYACKLTPVLLIFHT